MKKLSLDTADWALVEAQLPPTWYQLAPQYAVFRPDVPGHLGAKLQDPRVVLRLVLHHVVTNTSLRMTMALAAAVGLVDASAVALHNKRKKIGPSLWELVRQMVGPPADFQPERWAGYQVRLLDATTVTRPEATGSTARIHYVVRGADLAHEEVPVTDETGGETLRWVTACPGQLWVGDRVYANPPGIAAVVDQGAAVLVRYTPGALPLYAEAAEPLDVRDLVRTLQHPGQQGEWPLWVKGPKTPRIAGRLCVLRLSPNRAEQARERLPREHGSKVPPMALALSQYVIVFTTAEAQRLSTHLVLELYRLRWQVELRIKRDKSLGHLDALPNFRKDTIRSWLCAHVLAQLIVSRIATAQVAFPPRAKDKPPLLQDESGAPLAA